MSTKLSRRKFLAAMGVGGAAAAVVATQGEKQAVADKAAAKAAPQGGGYQVTAHVRRYYETTKV